MADYSKHQNHPEEKSKATLVQKKGSMMLGPSPEEKMAARNWRSFSDEGRKQVHNERFHGAARVNGPVVQAKGDNNRLDINQSSDRFEQVERKSASGHASDSFPEMSMDSDGGNEGEKNDSKTIKAEADAAYFRGMVRKSIVIALENNDPASAEMLKRIYASSFKMQDNITARKREGERMIREDGNIYEGKRVVNQAENYRGSFDTVIDLLISAEAYGYSKAIRNLEHYLSGTGTTMYFSYSELIISSGFSAANERLNEHFATRIHRIGEGLSRGEHITYENDLNAMDDGNIFSDSYYAFGTFTITGRGKIEISKDQSGNITVTGIIYKTFHDLADWNKGQSTPYAFLMGVTDDDMLDLGNVGGRPFKVRGYYQTEISNGTISNKINGETYNFSDSEFDQKTANHIDKFESE